jgi:hypothetical protein
MRWLGIVLVAGLLLGVHGARAESMEASGYKLTLFMRSSSGVSL